MTNGSVETLFILKGNVLKKEGICFSLRSFRIDMKQGVRIFDKTLFLGTP